MSAGSAPHNSAAPADVAVIGAGITGLACAWALARAGRSVLLLEAEAEPGGHARSLTLPEGPVVDCGVLVHTEPAYPNLTLLLRLLRIPTAPSDMSLGISLDDGSLDYACDSWAGRLAQPANLLKRGYWRMWRELLRFWREAPRLEAECGSLSLGALLQAEGFAPELLQDHLLPMASAIWSAPAGTVAEMPAALFLRFCRHHGLLQRQGRPSWRVFAGGSRALTGRLAGDLGAALRLQSRLRTLSHAQPPGQPGGWSLFLADGGRLAARQVVLAIPPDQALRALGPGASEPVRSVLSAFRATRNRVVVHRDRGLMPRRRTIWSSWTLSADRSRPGDLPQVSYWLNRLHRLPRQIPDSFVTLNPPREPRQSLARFEWQHPVLDAAALSAQDRLPEIQGVQGLWFGGAWAGWGFHEDGLSAGLSLAQALGAALPFALHPLSPAGGRMRPAAGAARSLGR